MICFCHGASKSIGGSMTSTAAGRAISGQAAIVGIGETDYVRGSEKSVLELVVGSCMEAIGDAGLRPRDVDSIIAPPGFVAWEEIAAHLGIPDVRYSMSSHMGGASPTA